MKRLRKLLMWQPVLTAHQAYTISSLAEQLDRELIFYVSKFEDPIRKSQGWSDIAISGLQRRQIPRFAAICFMLTQLVRHRREVHLFGSPFEQPRFMLCILVAALIRTEFYLISEPYSPISEGYFGHERPWIGIAKSRLRPHIYRGYCLLIRRRMSGVFAISKLAVAQYRKAGVPMKRIFPFGYFVPTPVPSTTPFGPIDDCAIRLVFVGSIIPRKGISILVQAVGRHVSEGANVTVDLYGPLSAPLPSNPGVQYRGTIPFGYAHEVISGYDALVLPSLYDGWGVVVNEALGIGVPVISSSSVGASVMVDVFGAGLTFASGDANALYDRINDVLRNPCLRRSISEGALLASKHIAPAVAARYMAAIISRPAVDEDSVSAPWYPREFR